MHRTKMDSFMKASRLEKLRDSFDTIDFIDENRAFFREIAAPHLTPTFKQFISDYGDLFTPFLHLFGVTLMEILNAKQQLDSLLTALRESNIVKQGRIPSFSAPSGPSVEQLLTSNPQAQALFHQALDTLKLISAEFKEYRKIPTDNLLMLGDHMDLFEAKTLALFESTSDKAITSIKLLLKTPATAPFPS